MRPSIALLSLLAVLFGCSPTKPKAAVPSPTLDAPKTRILMHNHFGDKSPFDSTTQPPPLTQLWINFPNDAWQPDSTVDESGDPYWVVNRTTRAAIYFRQTIRGVEMLAEETYRHIRDTMPPADLSPLVFSSDKKMASCSWDSFDEDRSPESRMNHKLAILQLPFVGRNSVQLFATGSWSPADKERMTQEFDYAIKNITYE